MNNLDLSKSYYDILLDSLRVIKVETELDSDEGFIDCWDNKREEHYTKSTGTYYTFGGKVTARFVLKVNDPTFINDYKDIIKSHSYIAEGWLNDVVIDLIIGDDTDVPEILTDIPYDEGMGFGEWTNLKVTKAIPFNKGFYLIQFTVDVNSDDDNTKQESIRFEKGENLAERYNLI